MKITIKDKEIELFYTYRMHIIYENIVGESLLKDYINIGESSKKAAALFYSCIIASAKKQKIELDLDFNTFMDWLDDNDDYIIVTQFLNFISNKLKDKYEHLADTEEDDELPKSTKKAKN